MRYAIVSLRLNSALFAVAIYILGYLLNIYPNVNLVCFGAAFVYLNMDAC